MANRVFTFWILIAGMLWPLSKFCIIQKSWAVLVQILYKNILTRRKNSNKNVDKLIPFDCYSLWLKQHVTVPTLAQLLQYAQASHKKALPNLKKAGQQSKRLLLEALSDFRLVSVREREVVAFLSIVFLGRLPRADANSYYHK